MSIQNDRLKGEFYRAPMTKLASRSNVITQINELIEYFKGSKRRSWQFGYII